MAKKDYLIYLGVPNEIKEWMEKIQRVLSKFVVPSRFPIRPHCTLAYGVMDDSDEWEMEGRLRRVVANKVRLEMTSLDFLSGRDGEKYLVANLNKREEFNYLQREIADIMRNYVHELTPFLLPDEYEPHITIAQVVGSMSKVPTLLHSPLVGYNRRFNLAEVSNGGWNILNSFNLRV